MINANSSSESWRRTACTISLPRHLKYSPLKDSAHSLVLAWSLLSDLNLGLASLPLSALATGIAASTEINTNSRANITRSTVWTKRFLIFPPGSSVPATRRDDASVSGRGQARRRTILSGRQASGLVACKVDFVRCINMAQQSHEMREPYPIYILCGEIFALRRTLSRHTRWADESLPLDRLRIDAFPILTHRYNEVHTEFAIIEIVNKNERCAQNRKYT